MSRDPEALGVANGAVAHVIRTKADEKAPTEACIRQTVKHHIWCWWRSIRCRPKLIQEQEEEAFQPKETAPQDADLVVGAYDWVLLHERYIERLPLDVLAARRGVSTQMVRRMILQAEDRFIIAMLLQDEE